jgi:hypothetical protein
MRPAGASPIMMQKGACADSESPLFKFKLSEIRFQDIKFYAKHEDHWRGRY